MKIIGISAYYHDSSAALIVDGKVVAAAQEERFTRKKHDSSFPANAVKYCLESQHLAPQEIDALVFFEKPFLKFERLLETYLSTVPRGFLSFQKSMPVWIHEKLFQKKLISETLLDLGFDSQVSKKLFFSDHHMSHAASAFYPSPFAEAVILTMDGVGEWATTSVCLGQGREIKKVRELHFPHSLGMLYSAFTTFCGFKVNSGEYKLMGLAPYGRPLYRDLIWQELVQQKPDGSFRLNMKYFNYCSGLTMTSKYFHQLFAESPRVPEGRLSQKHMDLAASIQLVCEEIILRLTSALHQEFQLPNLCLAGGVALNCVANGKILKQGLFKNIWIQPAAGDAGGGLGAALALYHQHFDGDRPALAAAQDQMQGAYLGPDFAETEIEALLKSASAVYQKKNSEDLLATVAQDLAEGKAVGWHQGRMEFGPRSLGGRSILADPRSHQIQKNLNLKIKFRESFRPFAPAVLAEHLEEWFDLKVPSPYMLLVAPVKKERQLPMSAQAEELFGIEKLNVPRSEIPAVTHVDYSARVQTVHKETNPLFHQLLEKFYKITGCPVLVNTSFNIRGEPIVCSPLDSYRCFMGTDLDILVVGDFYLKKEEQPKAELADYRSQFALD